METLLQDIRYGFRALLKRPGFSAMAVLSLALGIGLNSTIFSLVNAVLLRPLPVASPGELARLYQTTADGSSALRVSYLDYADYRDHNDVFTGLAGVSLAPLALGTSEQTDQVLSEIVTGNYFNVLGVPVAQGRAFMPDEDRMNASRVAIISQALWQRRFGGEATIIGKTVQLNGESFTVIGVADPTFRGTFAGAFIDVWVPLMQSGKWLGADLMSNRGRAALHMIGRRNPGVSMAQAQAAMQTLAAQLATAYPETNHDKSIELGPATLLHGNRRKAVGVFLFIIMAMVALVLLVACANVANLLLARALGRRREMAVRLALGATRWRLIRHLLTESVLLALVGGAAGLLIAFWATDLLAAFNPIPTVPLQFDFSLDARVVGVTFLISLLTGVSLGIIPALRASKWELATALRSEATAVTGGRRKSRMRNLLVASQVALSLVLLITSALFLQSLQKAQTTDPGFNPANAFAMDIDLKPKNLTDAQGMRSYQTIIERVGALPGVQAVCLANLAPLDIATPMTAARIDGHEPPQGQPALKVSFNTVSAGYFEAMQIPLVAGRDFNERDDERAPRIVIINETMAQRYWPGEAALGKQFRQGDDARLLQVIGVARDVKYRTFGEAPTPHLYLPFAQHYEAGMTLLVRASGEAKATMAMTQGELQTVATQGFFARTLIEHMGFALLPARLAAALLGAFGLLALLLAIVGIYGVMAYSVTERTHEIGIRMALGASSTNMLRLVIGQGMAFVLAGIAAGLAISFAIARVVSSLLFGVSATDPLTFAGMAVMLSVVALAASYIPARRAVNIDPMAALRHE